MMWWDNCISLFTTTTNECWPTVHQQSLF